MTADFEWKSNCKRAHHHILQIAQEQLFGRYFHEDVEDDVPFLAGKAQELQNNLEIYYKTGDESKCFFSAAGPQTALWAEDLVDSTGSAKSLAECGMVA